MKKAIVIIQTWRQTLIITLNKQHQQDLFFLISLVNSSSHTFILLEEIYFSSAQYLAQVHITFLQYICKFVNSLALLLFYLADLTVMLHPILHSNYIGLASNAVSLNTWNFPCVGKKSCLGYTWQGLWSCSVSLCLYHIGLTNLIMLVVLSSCMLVNVTWSHKVLCSHTEKSLGPWDKDYFLISDTVFHLYCTICLADSYFPWTIKLIPQTLIALLHEFKSSQTTRFILYFIHGDFYTWW